MVLGFSFACVFFFLGSILWYQRWEMFLGSVLMFLPSLIFAPNAVMGSMVIISSLLAFIAILVIHAEKRQRIRFQYFRINQAGQLYFILGLSLAIATAYFVIIRGSSWEELVPRLRLGEGSATFILKAASYWQPELKNLNRNQVSVDSYLLRLAADKNRPADLQKAAGSSQSFELELSLVPGMEGRLKEAGLSFADVDASPAAREYYLEMGREQLSLLAGREVSGSEPIGLVFSQVIQQRLIDTLEGQDNVSSLPVEAIPTALAVLLFLTLVPVGTLLAYVWLFIGYLVFLFLIRIKQMEIREHLDEVEELDVTDA